MKRIFILFSILLSSFPVFSQATRGRCGTNQSSIAIKKLLASKAMYEKLDIIQTEEIKYIPIKFHLIAKTDGTGRVKEYNLLRQLCILNEDFSNTDFQFFIKKAELNYFNSTPIYQEPRSSSLAMSQMQTIQDAKAIDVFVVNQVSSTAQGSSISYYDPNNDWIVLVKKEVEDGTNQLSHQMGHFFSLLHTFHGWGQGGSFNPSSPGWPIAPVNDPSGGLTENQNGSNCTIAGDFLCDTPPDYGFGWVDLTCNYTGGAKDPKGVLVNPMENNQMCYFNGCYPYIFTPDQTDMIHADYAKSSRNYLKSDYIPNTTQVTEQAILVSPTNYSNTNGNIGVVLDWDEAPNASYYLLEVSRAINFTVENLTYIVTESEKELPALTAGKNYFWKVTPFNEGASCVNGLTSAKWKFTASPLGTSNIEEINAWEVMPNPTTSSNIKFAIELDKALDITAQLVSVNGQILNSKDLKINSGKQVIAMPGAKLSNGTYFLRLISKNGMETRRLVIQK